MYKQHPPPLYAPPYTPPHQSERERERDRERFLVQLLLFLSFSSSFSCSSSSSSFQIDIVNVVQILSNLFFFFFFFASKKGKIEKNMSVKVAPKVLLFGHLFISPSISNLSNMKTPIKNSGKSSGLVFCFC